MSGVWKKRRRRAALRRLKSRLTVPLLRFVLDLLSRVSPGRAAGVGAAFGRLAALLLPGEMARIRRNLVRAFGTELSPARREWIARDCLRRLGMNSMEWAVLTRAGPERAFACVPEVTGRAHLEAATRDGRGVIAVTAHFGLFELIPIILRREGFPGKVVGRRHADSGLEDLITSGRRRMGVETIYQSRPREILRVLRDGGLVGTLPDQDIDKLPGFFLPFFGHPAWTVRGPATLAETAEVEIVPMFLHRLGPGRHRLAIHPPLPRAGGSREDRIRDLTLRLNRSFEAAIRDDPAAWAWIHDRWSTTPEKLDRRRGRRRDEEARRTRKLLTGRGGLPDGAAAD